MDIVPDGPRKVTSKNQVSLPAEQLESIGVGVGDSLWVMPNPDRPGTLVLMPRRLAAEVFAKGWTSL